MTYASAPEVPDCTPESIEVAAAPQAYDYVLKHLLNSSLLG
jgi:hypothetical protein